MAEDNKQPSVELDTDGVNEEIVNVAAPEEDKDTSFSKKEEVDLGYTDVSNNSSKEEVKVEQVKDEPKEEVRESKNQEDDSNLKDYSDNVQRRIKKLTFQAKESERRERAALDYAKGLKDKYESIQTKFDETDTNYLKEYNARVDAEREKVKAALKVALEAQDADQIMEANDKLTKLAVEKEKISMTLGEKEYRKKQQETQSAERPAGEPVELQQPKISQKAQRWAEDNDWFGSDRVLTSAAMGIHEDLVQQGIDAEGDEYYNQINKRMKEYFPHKFAQSTNETKQATPVQNVASVSRRSGGRKAVKLTKSQVVIAKKLGVPLEEYAKYVKEGA